MVTFNILGDCVSRDMLDSLIGRGMAQVNQYVSFSSPISICSSKANFEINMEDLDNYESSDFRKRCMCLDVNKQTFDYLYDKNSDYLIVDILDARAKMLKNGEHYITVLRMVTDHRESLDKDFGFDKYEDVSPNDITEKEWDDAIDHISHRILEKYSVSQIIINEHYGAEQYVDDNRILPYPEWHLNDVVKYNKLIKQLFDRLKGNLEGAHVIEFPENTIGNGKHRWGRYPLHYADSFYEYGAKAVEMILKRLPYEDERKKLNSLKGEYEVIFGKKILLSQEFEQEYRYR